MPIYIVKQGDCLWNIACAHGFSHWKPIYDHPENNKFRKKRPDPNILFPGDKLFIPKYEPKSVDASSDSKHSFVTKRQKTFLNIKFEEEPGEPMKGDYVLVVEGVEYKGALNGEGRLSERISADAKQGKLRIVTEGISEEDALRWELLIGSLDPLETLSGVQGRLWNLGIDCGPVDNTPGPLSKAGVKTFQKIAFTDQKEWDGIPGEKTQNKLSEHHEI